MQNLGGQKKSIMVFSEVAYNSARCAGTTLALHTLEFFEAEFSPSLPPALAVAKEARKEFQV